MSDEKRSWKKNRCQIFFQSVNGEGEVEENENEKERTGQDYAGLHMSVFLHLLCFNPYSGVL